MNKYQYSFERIKEECSKYHNFDIIDDFITLKELVEKSIPKKKETRKNLPSYISVCPVCRTLIPSSDIYCSNCGQRIDAIVGDE